MKTRLTIAMIAVLTLSLLTGCGCTNRNAQKNPEPTVLPTNQEIWDTTETATAPTVDTTTSPADTATVETTTPAATHENDTLNTTGATDPTANTDDMSRARRMMPDMR